MPDELADGALLAALGVNVQAVAEELEIHADAAPPADTRSSTRRRGYYGRMAERVATILPDMTAGHGATAVLVVAVGLGTASGRGPLARAADWIIRLGSRSRFMMAVSQSGQ